MATIVESKLTTKGQVTVPEPIRRRLRLEAGDRLEWRIDDRGGVVVRRVGGSLDTIQGLLGPAPRPVSVDEMDDAVRNRMRAGRRARG
jgi:AbrB family looped-hinge helix DNA binding protein